MIMKKNFTIEPEMNQASPGKTAPLYASKRRRKSFAMFLFALLGMFSFQLQAQTAATTPSDGGGGTAGDGCRDASCLTTSINISTGYDQVSGTYNTPLAQETNWTLVAVPSNAAITIPAPCWDITPHPAWSSFPNATWVSPFQNNAYWINNWPPNLYGAFEFQKCFCVCKDGSYNLRFELLCDDGAEVLVDGVPIATAFLGYQFQWAKRLIVNTNINLTPGTHCITVKLYNSGAVAMGFALEGSINGSGLMSPKCCNPNGRICGTKLWDHDCDGRVNPATDQGLPGWTIVLTDNLGNPIGSTVTDAYGNYCFENLPAGNYIVSEVMQTGWFQSVPGGSGVYNVSLGSGEVYTAYFGNCGHPEPPPCEFDLKYKYKIRDCAFHGTPDIGPLPAGYQVVSTQWTFGDGTTSDDFYAHHYYTSPGVYMVCLTVTIFNGTECCTRKYCREIVIEKRCDGGCEFQAEMEISFNPFGCTYTFGANVLYAGQPITSWFWDFGDGTYGSGMPVNHVFPGPGNYTVCLYIFSNIDDRCCVYKLCKDITVECDPCGGDGSTGEAGGDKIKPINHLVQENIELTDNVIILNQNVPNPFAESTIIPYQIQQDFTKAEIIFTNVDGRVIKTHNITQKGEGRLSVFADDLTSGIYLYSLVVDGKTIETKRMIKH